MQIKCGVASAITSNSSSHLVWAKTERNFESSLEITDHAQKQVLALYIYGASFFDQTKTDQSFRMHPSSYHEEMQKVLEALSQHTYAFLNDTSLPTVSS